MAKVLFYVDDDSDDLTIFLYAAKSLDIEIRLFSSGEHLIRHLEEFAQVPSVIFVDLNMPKISGYDVIQVVTKNKMLKNIPTIAFSTSADKVSVSKAKSAGATCYIVKPHTITNLKKSLQYVISNDWASHTDRDFLISD